MRGIGVALIVTVAFWASIILLTAQVLTD
jgi:hypothetical protein